MDLSKMSPKDKQRYEVAMECKKDFTDKLNQDIVPEDFEETLYMISRAEYKRGKADGYAEAVKENNKCGLSINGKCNGNFSPLDCNGMDIPEECKEMVDYQNSHNPEDSCAGVEKEIKPVVETLSKDKELLRDRDHVPTLTSPCDTTTSKQIPEGKWGRSYVKQKTSQVTE